MKKILVLILCLLLIGCGTDENVSNDNVNNNPVENEKEEVVKSDLEILKEEYEALNNSGIVVEINEDVDVKILNFDEAKNLLENETGIIYFGFPSCPWCRNILPVLLETLKENEQTLYYLNIRNINTEQNKYIKNILKDYLDKNSNGELTLYVPDVYAVQAGVIKSHHLGSASSQNNPYNALTEEQRIELKNIYQQLIDDIISK